MAIPKRAEPSLLTDQVYSALHEAIMNGDLPAGSRLRIRDLAAQVGRHALVRTLNLARLPRRQRLNGHTLSLAR